MSHPTLRALARLRNCPAHGQQPDNAWGCPECVRELQQEDEYLQSDLAIAREAVRRLVRWNLEAYDSEVVRGVYLWAAANHMTGPLLPLPEWLAKRERDAKGLRAELALMYGSPRPRGSPLMTTAVVGSEADAFFNASLGPAATPAGHDLTAPLPPLAPQGPAVALAPASVPERS